MFLALALPQLLSASASVTPTLMQMTKLKHWMDRESGFNKDLRKFQSATPLAEASVVSEARSDFLSMTFAPSCLVSNSCDSFSSIECQFLHTRSVCLSACLGWTANFLLPVLFIGHSCKLSLTASPCAPACAWLVHGLPVPELSLL